MKFTKRTNTCGELRASDTGKNAVLNGWVGKKRDLGGMIFIDIRDRYGITQLKISPENELAHKTATSLGNEFVISASGKVIERESKNKNLPTGDIELDVESIEILNASEVTPFVVEEDVKASEELRFKYRYLDIRRRKISDNLVLRSKVYQIVHRYFEKKEFLEVETPVMMKSTPEGARDYLVPSRVHHGKFYALPQSPQTYKQVLMVSGLDRYVQICKCFRDEDLRADRQPEFTQIDLEMSFVTQEDVFEICEGMIYDIWKEAHGIELTLPIKRMTYDEAMETYGSDKPDLRVNGDLKIVNVTNSLQNELEFHKGLRKESDQGNEIDLSGIFNAKFIYAGIKVNAEYDGQKIELTRKKLDELNDFVKKLNFNRLNFIKINSDGNYQTALSKVFSEESLANVIPKFEPKSGDTIFILWGAKKDVFNALGLLRLKIAEMYKLIDESKFEFLWVYDFPLFGYDEESKMLVAEHHAFTMPKDEDLIKLEKGCADPQDNIELLTSIRANCYDMVCNGNEFGSGSIRIHRRDIQEQVFKVMNLTEAEQKEKFGFLLDAFRYGAPPHGGFAFGFDRIIAMLCGTKDIRETIAFPKSIDAVGNMEECPNEVSQKQLDELGIEIDRRTSIQTGAVDSSRDSFSTRNYEQLSKPMSNILPNIGNKRKI